jgi:hypothetical protein
MVWNVRTLRAAAVREVLAVTADEIARVDKHATKTIIIFFIGDLHCDRPRLSGAFPRQADCLGQRVVTIAE